MIKFLLLEFLGLLDGENSMKDYKCYLPFANSCINSGDTVFKFQKCAKYANEITHDIIY